MSATRRVWLPLALSLALHALFALAAIFFSAGSGSGAAPSLPVSTLVPSDAIILEGPPPAGAGRGAGPQRTEEEQSDEPFPATVEPAPVLTPVSVPIGPEDPLPRPGEGAGGGSGQGGAAVGALRAPAAARKVVYVIDRSISMGDSGALAVAKSELLGALDGLSADARFAVILYNGRAEPLTLGGEVGLVPATAANRDEAAGVVRAALAMGGTDHLAALRRAVALGPDVIFFVTDASELTADQARAVSRLNFARAVVNTVEINNDREGTEETPLKLLARLNGGTHRLVRVTK